MATDNEEREWKAAYFDSLITNPQLKALAWQLAEAARGDGDPVLAPGDQEAGRRYLRKCLTHMSMVELQRATVMELAGLLARGTVGAARYRTRTLTAPLPSRRRSKPDR